MGKILGLVIGLALGAAVGAAVVMLVSPATGDKLIANIKRGYRETLDDARIASEQRRAALEAELRIRK